jgi:hypothetical protein
LSGDRLRGEARLEQVDAQGWLVSFSGEAAGP